jgi:acetyl-CoA carboxylase biotin carboxyl carrier protein
VSSPIVGTYYSASSPASPPFASIGDRVQSGQTLCIIEAMKLMNEIQADASGTVARIFVENGQPVEFGQPLFGLRIE